jgi:hypothetical protein
MVSGLKLYPAQELEEAIRLPMVERAVEHTAISAEELLILFVQAAWQVVLWLLY